MAKGSSGSRRWIQRRAIDTRRIVGMHEIVPGAPLERLFQRTCYIMGAGVAAIGVYAFAADYLAGHL